MSNEAPLKDFLIRARDDQLDGGWLYLAQVPPELETRCLLLNDDGAEVARERGFPFEGLDCDCIATIVDGTRDFADPPSEALMLEAFNWYLEYDAFLPEPGAAPLPRLSREESQLRMDRAFYERLGGEDPEKPCKSEGCQRGQLSQSLFCRVHHFEMLHHRPCPFTD